MTKFNCIILLTSKRLKTVLLKLFKIIQIQEDDLLFDIINCNFHHVSMQYVVGKCNDKKLIEDIEGKIAQFQLTNNPTDEIVPQITMLASELNSIKHECSTKMLNNRTAFYVDCEISDNFFSC